MFLLILSFIAGALTVLAPCTLPLLPVIVGESVSGKPSYRRALVVIGSLGASLFLFTLLLKVSTAFINVPPAVWQWLSGGLIMLFGLATLFPNLWDTIPGIAAMNRGANKALGQGYLKQSSAGDVLIGAALGPVFSSCSPTYFIILATVLPANLTLGLVYLAIYVLGLCLALLAIAVLGQRLVGALGIAADPNGWFKKALGVLFILIGIAIFFGLDKTLENALTTHAGVFDVTKVEQALIEDHAGAPTSTPSVAAGTFLTPEEKMLRYPKAPELAGIDGYLNTGGQPISLAQYRGKDVVLIDFWTYSCINCQRTLPYLTAWYKKYKDQGLVIIGVHTPEFAFEHLEPNVAAALKQFGIEYPVVLDNEYATWNAFGNQFWPREYLIDIDGYIVHDHAGEGEYDVTEKAIQAALAERAARLGTGPVSTSTTSVNAPTASGVGSPETYFGAARNEFLGNGSRGVTGEQKLTIPKTTDLNTLYLGGTWNFDKEFATAGEGSEVTYEYASKQVYLVASADSPAELEVTQDGSPLGGNAGTDAPSGIVQVGQSRLYRIVANPASGVHTLHIRVKSGTVHFYTFTFG